MASQARGRPLANAANLLFTGQSGPVVPADTSAPPGYLLEPDEACPGSQSVVTSTTQTENLDAILKESCQSRPNLFGHVDDVNHRPHKSQQSGAALINRLVPNGSRSITV